MSLTDLLPSIAAIRAAVKAAHDSRHRVGFVPTMGALHAGHAKLIETARAESDFVVVSIFVNPTQFGPNEDFGKYPRTLEADRQLCGQAGADAIFAPSAAEMYPAGFRGKSRSGNCKTFCAVRRGRAIFAALARWSPSCSISCSRTLPFSGRKTPSKR